MYTQSFFVEGQYLGAALRKPVHLHGEVQPPPSYAFFCPVCAEVWARAPVTLGPHTQEFMVWRLACRKHGRSRLTVAGSLFLPWDKSFNEALPDGAWFWELERHLDHIEKAQE